MGILALTSMFLKLVCVWCLLLGSPLLCVAGARHSSEAHDGPAVSASPDQRQQRGKDTQGQQAHHVSLVQSHSGAAAVEPRACPADPVPPQPYGFDYLDPLASIATIKDGVRFTWSPVVPATNGIENSAALSDASQQASRAQNSATTPTDAAKSEALSAKSTSVSAPLSGFTTWAALPVGGTRQARTASSTSITTPHTSVGCGADGQCLGSVSVATPAAAESLSTTSGKDGAWTSTIGFWTSSWHKCFKDATGTELRSCPATTANNFFSSFMYTWCHHGVLRGERTVTNVHRRPDDGTLPCLIIADTVYLISHTDSNGGDSSCILDSANLYWWPFVGAMQSYPTAYNELDFFFIVTTNLYRRPNDRALPGPTTQQQQQHCRVYKAISNFIRPDNQPPRSLYWGSDEWTMSHQWYGRHVNIDASDDICKHYSEIHSNNIFSIEPSSILHRRCDERPMSCERNSRPFHVVRVPGGRVKLKCWACHYQDDYDQQQATGHIGVGSAASLYRGRDERPLRFEWLWNNLNAAVNNIVLGIEFDCNDDSGQRRDEWPLHRQRDGRYCYIDPLGITYVDRCDLIDSNERGHIYLVGASVVHRRINERALYLIGLSWYLDFNSNYQSNLDQRNKNRRSHVGCPSNLYRRRHGRALCGHWHDWDTTPAALPGPSSIALPVCVDGLMSGPCIVIGTAGLSKSTPGVTAAVPTVAECSQSPLPPSSPSLNDTSPLSGYPPKTTSPLYGPTAAIPSTTVTSNSTSSSLEIATSLVDALRGSQAQSTAWSSNQTDSISSSPSTTTTTHIATVFADAPESPSSTSSSGDMPGWSGSTTSWEIISASAASRSISIATSGGRLGPGYPPMGHDLERQHQ
ncbi:hypothetical protein OOU_Y34scaffold00666g169 [Pyricularia oryzae Y34]|uniref:Membrane-associated protein n=3 Tax=Pyricularia oryzae TaxID=318829 RepID=Q2KGG7_PYRO7|nr:hypothetical protein MGCH7_ch7g368 [Pyricularia oryzae 70-15]ELQ36308.1 hypothetical protein OOU_Y34scaffold00666g169 [Pyricularia oryzae Y34]